VGQVLWESTFVPEWRTILNVAWEIALGGFSAWIELFERLGNEADTYVVLVEKLCDLALKSIEDSMICEMWEGAKDVCFEPQGDRQAHDGGEKRGERSAHD
jgi:hypothetical protein